MQHMLSVSFYIKRHRLNERNEVPIIIRLKLQGTTRDISAGLRVNPMQWNSKFGAVKGTSESAKQINGQLTAEQGLFWLEITRAKTAQSTQIPLFPVAVRIIKKYNKSDEHDPGDRLLPTLRSN